MIGEMKRESRSAGSAGYMVCARSVSAQQGGQCARRTAPEWTSYLFRMLVAGLLGVGLKQILRATMGTPQNYDSRIYTCCAPWKGGKRLELPLGLQAELC